jgi:hypothetical protein
VTVGVVLGVAKVAVMVVLAFNVILHASVAAEVHPAQEPKVLLPAVVGAVTVTAVPAL